MQWALDEPAAAPAAAAAPQCKCERPAELVFQSVVSFPVEGQPASITIANVGGCGVNLTDYTLTDSDKPSAPDALAFKLPGCKDLVDLQPGRAVTLLASTNASDTTSCAFKFGLSFR